MSLREVMTLVLYGEGEFGCGLAVLSGLLNATESGTRRYTPR